jgi:subtilisin family serine protease
MAGGRFLVPALLVSGLLALGCSGMGGSAGGGGGGGGGFLSGGGDNSAKGAKGDRSKLKVGVSAAGDRKGHKGGRKGPDDDEVRSHHKKGEYIVKLSPGVSRSEFLSEVGAENQRAANREVGDKRAGDALGLGRTIRFKSNKPERQVISKLEKMDEVEWVEPVQHVRAHGAPNDPYWSYQWHMQALKMPQAWQITKGQGTVVAVIDTGVSEGQDGFFKLLQGKDFVDGDNRPNDEHGHGTHVAGTIAQATDNGIGVAGVAPKASILPVRVLDANGGGDNNDVAEGIIWAVDHGANIINMSLGSSSSSEVVADAVAYAYEKGVTVVCATGNDGFSDFVSYPAALPTPIAVGAVDANSKVTFYSNQGREIDIVAPGGDTGADVNNDGMEDGVVQETRMNGEWSYFFLQGTSMATPHVAGVAALVHANGVTDPDAIYKVLTKSANDLGARGWDTTYGYGMVDPVAALEMKNPRGAGRGKAGKGGKGGGGGDDELEIANVKVKNVGDERAIITWTTDEPAVSAVSGTNGFQRRDDTLTKIHRVSVRGKPGSNVEFTILARHGRGDADKTKVDVKF